ncbi:DUF1906 domain-containing protein [Streptomyces sp. NPDC049577]|uniref:DUF1906 domain-containing protein n=1 Tax=Streptomyces sp. NPDC049577 TaxID=3155153 RepID=UPI00343A19F9
MDRRRKIIGYLVALTAAVVQLAVQTTPASAAGPGGDGWGVPVKRTATVFRGHGFDTCEAPPLTTLSAWRNSDYRAVGVYFAGRARACPRQRWLSSAWLTGARDLGWKVLPVFVGSQSPCVRASNKRGFLIGDDPYDQGIDEGQEAVRAAGALGIVSGSPLYLDMEAYDDKDDDCARTTLSYIRAWTATVNRFGYLSGFYSSAESGVRHMERARRNGTDDLPDVVWFARWRVPGNTAGEPVLSASAWAPHRRIHQYAGNVTETYGGRKLTIDRNLIDAPVAVIE